MALTAPSAVLTGSTIASSFDQLLFLDAAAGMTEATLKIVSTEVGKSALSISDEHVLIKGVDTNNAAGFEVQQTDGTSILKVAAGTPSVLVSGSGTKLYLSDAGGEYISGDGTDLTIAAGTALNITADVIDLSDATKDVTLNAAVDAINFDSNTLSIDASNNRVGLGTASPTATLDVRGKIYMETSDPGIELLDTGTAPYNPLIFKALRSGGSAVQSGEDLGIIYAQGYDGGAYRDFGQIRFAAANTVSSGDAPGRIEFWTTPDGSTTIAEKMRIESDGNVFIGENANGNNSRGLTINQGAFDDEILSFKSSDVSHNMGNLAETDTYGTISKTDGGSGGLKITGYKDGDGSTDGAVRIGGNLGEAADTAKTTGGYGVIRFIAQIGSGDDNTSVVGSNGNMVTIDNGGTTRFIFDAEGDSHQDVGTAWTNFDNENDAMVSRSLGVVMGPDTIIKTKWDDWGRDHKEDLVRCGIMPELSPEEIKKGETPLVNTTQVMRLHNGAIWQQYTEMQKMKELMYDTMVEMIGKEKADDKLKDHDIKLLNNKTLLN